jgi:hypothetical protein
LFLTTAADRAADRGDFQLLLLTRPAAAASDGSLPMNDDNTDLDQVDEEILTYTVSDEALEAVASTARWTYYSSHGGAGCC